MKTIWKYPLKLIDKQTIATPFGAEPLTCLLQYGFLTVWALVETENTPAEPFPEIQICGTGHPRPEQYQKYLGSVVQDGFVWHVFWL